MKMRKIYLFVEGSDDVLFMEHIIVPLLRVKYDDVEIIQFAQMKRVKTMKYIESIDTLGFDYLLLTDIDQEPSISHKQQFIMERLPIINFKKIVIVISEIESWYLAGVSSDKAKE